jgi:hypothetical protein
VDLIGIEPMTSSMPSSTRLQRDEIQTSGRRGAGACNRLTHAIKQAVTVADAVTITAPANHFSPRIVS